MSDREKEPNKVKDEVVTQQACECGTEEQKKACTRECSDKETKPELSEEEKAKLEQQQEFFRNLRRGGMFLQFVLKDINAQVKDNLNRSQRRRIQKELRKGIISRELAQLYLDKAQMINDYIEEKLNPPTEVDGAKLYEEAKKAEQPVK